MLLHFSVLEPMGGTSPTGRESSAAGDGGGRSSLSLVLDIATVVLLAVAVWALVTRGHEERSSEMAARSSPVDERVTEVAELQVRTESEESAVPLATVTAPPPWLLLVFRSDCQYCAREKSTWRKLAIDSVSGGVTVIGLTSERLRPEVLDYFGSEDVEVFRVDRQQLREKLGSRVVPTTIAVNRNRRIAFRAAGVMSSVARDSLRRLLERRTLR